MLAESIKRDASRHLLHDNLDDFLRASEKWLLHPNRRRQHTLGVGIDRSDSLLYEGVIQHVRNLAPLFSDPDHNPCNKKLILLTKTPNTHDLAKLAPPNRH